MQIPTRRAALGLVAALLFGGTAALHAAPQADLEQKYQKKLQKEFIEYGGWITDYDEARAKAKEEDKVLFVYFSRSYAP